MAVLYLKCIFIIIGKAEFSASLLQNWMPHDPSEIFLICWFAQETILMIINVENGSAA